MDPSPGSVAPKAATPPPDLPTVPRPVMSRFAKVVLGFCVLIIGGYTATAMTGWEPAQPKRDEVPASVRNSPGGYRTFHFWHSGYHGGK